MTAPLSIVIPTLNAATELPATCDALLTGVTDGLVAELILSDGGSSDDIATVARELGAELVLGAAGRGGQIARGVAHARAPWVLILHADTHLTPNWANEALHHIHQHPTKAGWFRLAFRAKGIAPKIVAGGANLRSRLLGLPYGDQGLLVSKDLLNRVGGIPDLPLMEDVALARRLKGRMRGLNTTARTSPARYQADGWARRTTRNLCTLARYMMGANPENLSKTYHGANRK